jgi:hypothetical protein
MLVGVLVYVLMLALLRVPELKLAWITVKRRLLKRTSGESDEKQ